jgi:glycosyltransferase involved in cell wall biosynthesis
VGDQFDYFSEKGYVFFVACRPDNFFFDYTKQKGVTALPVNILRTINPIEDIKAIFKLRKARKTYGIDTVVAHTPKGGMTGIIAAYLAGTKKRVYFRHGLMYETSQGLKRRLLVFIESITGRLATDVVCVSPSVLAKSEKEKLNNPAKNILLHKGTCNGIDVYTRFSKALVSAETINTLRQQYDLHPYNFVVGYVGRLVKDKGIQELLNAWKRVIAQFPHARLLLVGPYEERDSINEEYKQYIHNEPSIIHTGLITNVTPLYALMNVFILPSYREGFPTVVLEASSMELPVITTRNTGCIDSIIENKTGIFTDITPEAIFEQITFYINNPDIAGIHGKNGRNFVIQNFEQQIIWNEIEQKLLA